MRLNQVIRWRLNKDMSQTFDDHYLYSVSSLKNSIDEVGDRWRIRVQEISIMCVATPDASNLYISLVTPWSWQSFPTIDPRCRSDNCQEGSIRCGFAQFLIPVHNGFESWHAHERHASHLLSGHSQTFITSPSHIQTGSRLANGTVITENC